MIRTPRCHYSKEQAIEKMVAVMGYSEEARQEVNLRSLYFEAQK